MPIKDQIFAIIIAIKNKKPELNDHTICEPKSIIEQILATNPDKKYLKLKGGEILNENTNFSEYAFISNNSIYIFNPQKLDSGEFEYKKVYDIDKNTSTEIILAVSTISTNSYESIHI